MGRKKIFTICLIILICSASLSASLQRSRNCFQMRVDGNTVIYTESNLATNIVTHINPNDVIYICGD